jgi:hypothetical protein
MDEDLTKVAMEDKTLFNTAREFLFGESEIPRKNGTLWSSTVGKLGLF